MKRVLNQFINPKSDKIIVLTKLINKLRIVAKSGDEAVIIKIKELQTVLTEDQTLGHKVKNELTTLISSSNQTELYTQIHLISEGGLFSELMKRIFRKALPQENDPATLKGIINIIFYKKNDFTWIARIPNEAILELLHTLSIVHPTKLSINHIVVDELLNDIYILSQVIVSLSINRNVVKNFNEVLTVESPFMRLHELVDDYLTRIDKQEISRKSSEPNYLSLLQMMEACYRQVEIIRESKSHYGTSIELTLVLHKINSSLDRMKDLLRLIISSEEEKNSFIFTIDFIKQLIKNENEKNGIRNYFNQTVSLLAFQITEHTGKIGEHYIVKNKQEYLQMFYNAMKGGMVVGILVISKFILNGLKFPIFHDTVLKSLNYSFGFIGIQLVHGTLATKQPSMTASVIAHSIEDKSKETEVKEIGELIIQVIRSQFIAVVGNIILAFPVSFFIAWGWYLLLGENFANGEEAIHKVYELNPFSSLCIIHAAIAGVMLFLSGTLAGMAENANIYHAYSNRLKKQPFLLRVFGKKCIAKFSTYVGTNVGGLTGNFTLGFLLAFVAFFGHIIGLPLDIQHVTFASGNLGMAMASSELAFNQYDLFMACLGILLIGTFNILVSFSLALIVAIKSRGIKITRIPQVLKYLLKIFLFNPLHFFIPNRKKEPIDHTNGK